MIAVDTSSWIAFLADAEGPDAVLVEQALVHRQACMPPVVLTELLSDPKLPERVQRLLVGVPLLEIFDGYWQRAGALRAKVLRLKQRAPLADTLIAQNCLDHEVALVTRDTDFRHFARAGGLRLVVE
jgi:predicted nucleic acid-binding protein